MPEKKILTIDDDPFYKQLLNDILTAHGYEVDHAMDIAEAWSKVKSFEPDLITLDIMMPEKEGVLDGFAFLEQFRDCGKECAGIPIIMISALEQEQDRRRAAELGATDFITKRNLTPELLIDEINRLLNQD